MLTTTDVKLHLRIDYDDEDAYLNILLKDATEYVTIQTQIENDFDAPAIYDRCCLLLIGHWYSFREAVVDGNHKPIPFGVTNLISLMRRNEDMF